MSSATSPVVESSRLEGPHDPRARQLPEQPRPHVSELQILVAEHAEDEDGHVLDCRRDVHQEQQTRLVGCVKIIEDDDEWPFAGGRQEAGGDRREQLEARVARGIANLIGAMTDGSPSSGTTRASSLRCAGESAWVTGVPSSRWIQRRIWAHGQNAGAPPSSQL